MALEVTAGGWERDAVERSTTALPGLLTSIALHGAVLALLIASLHSGMNAAPSESAPAVSPAVSRVSLVSVTPAVEPVAEPLPQWGLRKAAPEPAAAAPAALDPLMEETALPQMTSEMASLPLTVFEPAAAKPEQDAVAIEPARRVPPPASVKVRKAQAKAAPSPAPAAEPVRKPKPKPVAKPAAAKAPAKPDGAVSPAGDPAAKSQSAATSAAVARPAHASAATVSTSPVSAPISDAPVLVTNPNYAGACPIQYPERARRRSQEGTVLIHALIGIDGKPIEVTVASSSGHSLLDDAARAAIAECAFVPQRVGGRAVKAIVEIPIPFKLI